MTAALARGERGLILSFDEPVGILMRRAAGLGMDITAAVADGCLQVKQIDPAEISPASSPQ